MSALRVSAVLGCLHAGLAGAVLLAGCASGEANCMKAAGPDVPDPAFVDSDCDGIDGDVSAAIFAAPDGDDAGAGTMDSPVKSLARGISLARMNQKIAVYASRGTYAEAVTLQSGI